MRPTEQGDPFDQPLPFLEGVLDETLQGDSRSSPGEGGTAEPDAAVEPGQSLGRYLVTGTLGAGGMGEVLAVRDPRLGRQIAAKVMRDQSGSEQRARFVQEARITGMLEHPNIVPLHELGQTEDGRSFFTMKRIRGEDLRHSIADRPLFELLQILLKVCDALAFAHSEGVVHRDLKPANIMIGRFGEVQVMDWGLAKVVGEQDLPSGSSLAPSTSADGAPEDSLFAGSPQQTQVGAVLGTCGYMAPEQASGRIDRLDRRADVYAVGVMLYEMLAGVPPYRGRNPAEVLFQVRRGQPLPPGQRAPERQVPHELEAVALKAMALRPADRYDELPELQQEILAFLEGRALKAAHYSAWQLLKKWAGRNKPAVAATVGVLCAVIAAVVAIAWQLGVTRRAYGALKLSQAATQQMARRATRQHQRATREAENKQAIIWVHKAEELYRRRGAPDQISSLLARAERVDPGVACVLRLRGEMALDRKRWAQAKALLYRALQQDRTDYVTHFLLFRWYAEQGHEDTLAAKKHAWEAASFGTQDTAIGLWGLARRTWRSASRHSGPKRSRALQRAVSLCTRALDKRPGFLWALELRAACHDGLGAWKAVEADYIAAIDRFPECARLYNYRAVLFIKLKRYEAAMTDLQLAIRVDPRLARGHYNLGNLYKMTGRSAEALASYSRAIALDPGYADAYNNRGSLYRKMKRYAQALSDFDRAIQLDPRHTKAHHNRGSLHYTKKRYEQALSDFDRAVRLDARHANAHCNRGNLHFAEKRYAQALSDYDRAIALDARHASAHCNRGNLHFVEKRYAQALSDFDLAIRIDAGYVKAYILRGELHAHHKRVRLALADWLKALPLIRQAALRDKLVEKIERARKRLR